MKRLRSFQIHVAVGSSETVRKRTSTFVEVFVVDVQQRSCRFVVRLGVGCGDGRRCCRRRLAITDIE